MPLFQYRAQDNQGRSVEGAVTADTKLAAQTALKDRGLRIFDLVEKGGPAAVAPAPRTVAPTAAPRVQPAAPPAPAAANFHTPVRRAGGKVEQINQNQPAPAVKPIQAGPQKVNMPAPPPAAIVRTKRGTDTGNTFLFAQLASYFRAGVNPAEAFTQLQAHNPRPEYQQSLAEAAKATTEGVRFSQVLERYPDLYAPHIVGMIRASEEAGYLVEACEQVAKQTEDSRRFGYAPKVFFWFSLLNLVFLPPSWLVFRAALDSWDAQDKAGGSLNGWSVLGSTMGQSLKWPVGPAVIALLVFLILGNRWWMSLDRRPLRHAAILKVPSLGKRVRAESVAVFTWTLSMVSWAGIPARDCLGLGGQGDAKPLDAGRFAEGRRRYARRD